MASDRSQTERRFTHWRSDCCANWWWIWIEGHEDSFFLSDRSVDELQSVDGCSRGLCFIPLVKGEGCI